VIFHFDFAKWAKMVRLAWTEPDPHTPPRVEDPEGNCRFGRFWDLEDRLDFLCLCRSLRL
jgi:hypothetical protein